MKVHQEKVLRKKNRRSKWENYKKTQAMIYNKTTCNYNKWDAFESSEESEHDDSEPILPRDDPNFRAMETEMLDRRKKRQRDGKEANEFKVRGNEALQKGLYKTAQKYYSDALELRRDILPIYTNRALSRLKLEDYPGVIDDCTRVLEYCEVFHDGYTKERDLCYKALMRRCQALRAQKDYPLALKDLEEAAKLIPGDENVEKLVKLTEEDIEVEKRIKAIMGSAELLKGKEYLDYVVDFLQGKKDTEA